MSSRQECAQGNEYFSVERQDGVSFLQMSAEIQLDKKLKPTDKAIYATLCLHCDGILSTRRECYPSVQRIADETNCSLRTAQRSIQNLVERGAITIKRTRQKNGYQGHNVYVLMNKLPKIQNDEDENQDFQSAKNDQNQSVKNDSLEIQRVKNDVPACQKGHHVTITKNYNQEHIPPIIPPTEPEPEKPRASEEQPLELSAEKKPEKSKRSARKTAEEYTPEFEAFWAAYPTYGRRKKAAFDAWKRLLRLKAATPDELIHAARRYADMCRATCKEEQYTLHAASFLGPVKEAWRDYIGPEVQMGRELKDVDISRFRREDGSVDVKAFERARRGLR